MPVYRYVNLTIALFTGILWQDGVSSHDFTAIVKRVKPSVVGIGLYDALGVEQHQLRGSGFVFGNGQFIATNYHIVSQKLDPIVVQYWTVYVGIGQSVDHLKQKLLPRILYMTWPF
jgi:serine protease Do